MIWLTSQITACGQRGDLVLPETGQAKKAKKLTSHLYGPKTGRRLGE